MTEVTEIIRRAFRENGNSNPARIPYIRVNLGHFNANLRGDGTGIEVDILGGQPFLPWAAFQHAVCAMIASGGTALKGDVMGPRLGDDDLPLNSIEGRIAHRVYGRQPGDAVFKRITPIACILIWAGICEHIPRHLRLRPGVEIRANCED
jgi:hypothetical protein